MVPSQAPADTPSGGPTEEPIHISRKPSISAASSPTHSPISESQVLEREIPFDIRSSPMHKIVITRLFVDKIVFCAKRS